MKQKAEAFVWALGRGDTKAMVQALSEETAQVLSAYRLSEMSQQLGWLLGELLAVEEIEAAEQGARLTVKARFAKMTARVKMTLTAEGNVAGFGLDLPQQPLPPLEPVTCADFAELPIKVGAAAQMDGLLTLPAGASKPPVVIFCLLYTSERGLGPQLSALHQSHD